jgi:hypothetical protein
MKKLLITSIVLSVCFNPTFAQQTQNEDTSVDHIRCTGMIKTAPLRDMIPYLAINNDNTSPEWKPKDRKKYADPSTITEKTDADPIAQTEDGWRDGSGMTKVSWNGMGGGTPPDPTGAAGLEYYVQAKNATYRVYNKDGSPATTTFSLSQLWSGESDGDPIVMYDRYAERWFISQFRVDQAGSNDGILIAISETADPTGAYYAYTFDTPMNGFAFPDYPKFGVWPNGYYMSANSSYDNCMVFEREKMLVGDPTASVQIMNFPSTIKFFFRSFAPSYAEGLWSPGSDDPFYFFHIQDDAWSGVSNDHIKVIECNVDWSNSSNSSVQVVQEIPISAVNTMFTQSWDDVAQQGSSQKLDAVASIFMYRAQYIKRPGHNTVLMCATVDVNGNNSKAGIRWVELRQDASDPSGDWSLYQEGTYAPDNNSRWMGSMAMDINGHIGMAYCYSGTSAFPGIRYTGRFDGDPLGEMTVSEQIAIEGSGAQSGINRYGDYSQMSLDPGDDATFWFTGEYMGGANAVRTRVFSFAMWELVGNEEIEKPTSFNAYQPDASTLKVTWSSIKDDQFDIQLIDLNGKIIKTERVNNAVNEMNFDLPSYAKGIYMIHLVGENTQLSKKVYLN